MKSKKYYIEEDESVLTDSFKKIGKRINEQPCCCLITDGKLMPPIVSIENMDSSTAYSIEKAAKERKFTSKEDLILRTGVNYCAATQIQDLGLL